MKEMSRPRKAYNCLSFIECHVSHSTGATNVKPFPEPGAKVSEFSGENSRPPELQQLSRIRSLTPAVAVINRSRSSPPADCRRPRGKPPFPCVAEIIAKMCERHSKPPRQTRFPSSYFWRNTLRQAIIAQSDAFQSSPQTPEKSIYCIVGTSL